MNKPNRVSILDQWRKKRASPIGVGERQKEEDKQGKGPKKADRKKNESKEAMMTSVLPQLTAACGMGTFSQKEVDKEFLKYLNG